MRLNQYSAIIDKYVDYIQNVENNIAKIDSTKNSGIEPKKFSLNLPSSISEFIGQDKIIDSVKIAIESSRITGKPLDHILLYGQPGLGKSFLANVIANEAKYEIKKVLGSELSTKSYVDEVFNYLTLNQSKKILFIDEIHNIPLKVAERLYDPIQEFSYSGQDIKPFTIVGATTYLGEMPKPLRDRFVYQYRLEPYSKEDIKKIIIRYDKNFNEETAEYIAVRSKGVPRIAIHYCTQIKNAAIADTQQVNVRHAKFFMGIMQINQDGLTKEDIKLLQTIAKSTKPISKNNLCSIVSIDPSDFDNIIEPYLLRIGLIEITTRGRELTRNGLGYLVKNKYI